MARPELPKWRDKPKPKRDEFLLAMYGQLMNDINRHLTMIWQPAALLVTTFAVLAVTKEVDNAKGIIPLDYATVLVILICTWAACHFVDASFWYNRNLIIIGNIERYFLKTSDAKEIQWYFLTHRKGNSMISFLQIQSFLALGIAIVVLVFHGMVRLVPTCCSLSAPLEPQRGLPYVAAVLAALFVNYWKRDSDEKYREFAAFSPGKEVDVPDDIRTALGHGGRRTLRKRIALAFGLKERRRGS